MLRSRVLAVLFLIIGIAAGYFDWSGYFPFNLGPDLQGGISLEYKADTSRIPQAEVSEAMAGLRDVIERRVNIFGVSEPRIQTKKVGGENRLVVDLAGVFDISEAIKIIGETPYLEFRALRPGTDLASTTFADFIPTALTGRYLNKASVDFQNALEPAVLLDFNEEGTKLFGEITRANVGKPVAIYLDGLPISSPIVQEEISSGGAQITGRFTAVQARDLVRRLNSGALPIPISLGLQQGIGASLGERILSQMISAGIYGTIAVALFLLLFYRLPGLAAVVALAVYAALALAIFKLIPVYLTAAGIAGFILSIGMAVDANILIFERTREELRAGKSLALAVEEGFSRAWLSIRDSNVSSLITSLILFALGTQSVKGFALTLGLGIILSMFSAITVTRTFLRALEFREGRKIRILYGAR
ncbi:MAG: protein translocase subunit SecD [bacterium]|nr:protein translocase subunit SecD [bacterium]